MKDAKKMCRLYDLLERRIKGCRLYEYARFSVYHDVFNECVEEEGLDETLNELAEAIYGQGSRWFEITDDLYDGAGKFCIETDDDRLEIDDITEEIPVFESDTRFFILVNGTRSEHQWVIAVPQCMA